MKPAIFIDRDGTINEQRGYINHISRFVLLPGVGEGISLLNEHNRLVLITSNQSGVARGLFDEEMVAAAHQKIQKMLLEKGARIDAFFYCPHHPTASRGIYLKNCPCRKPAPGMLYSPIPRL